jgi:hypothetical protein
LLQDGVTLSNKLDFLYAATISLLLSQTGWGGKVKHVLIMGDTQMKKLFITSW